MDFDLLGCVGVEEEEVVVKAYYDIIGRRDVYESGLTHLKGSRKAIVVVWYSIIGEGYGSCGRNVTCNRSRYGRGHGCVANRQGSVNHDRLR